MKFESLTLKPEEENLVCPLKGRKVKNKRKAKEGREYKERRKERGRY